MLTRLPPKTFRYTTAVNGITTAEAAALLGKSKSYVLNRIEAGVLPAARFAHMYVVRVEDVLNLKRRRNYVEPN